MNEYFIFFCRLHIISKETFFHPKLQQKNMFVSLVILSSVFSSAFARLAVNPAEVESRNLRNLADKFCTTPVSKSKVNFSDKLIGRANVNFDMYSGYVNVTSVPDYLFYWFFGTKDLNPEAPLIIWTNGGPGCTAMEGATTETGPLWFFIIYIDF